VRRIIAWFVANPVAANLLMAVLVIGGLVAAPQLPQKIFPDVDSGIVMITVAYRSAPPDEVEQGVCVPIEEEIEGVNGVETVRSTASEGQCRVRVDLYPGADGDVVTSEIKNRVDGIRTFPEEAETPVVSKLQIRHPVVDVALSGEVDEETLKRLGRRVRDEIASLPEVTQVDLVYDRDYEVSIEVSEESLRRFGLSFDQVVRAVRRSSIDLPGGSLKAEGGEILLRSVGRAYRGADFARIVVLTRADGTRVTLGEIARVVDGFESEERSASFDGEPAMLIRVQRTGDEGVLTISKAVRRYVAEAGRRLPEGVRLTVWKDASVALRGRLDTLIRNGRSGMLLVFAVLALFLRFRLAVWVTAGVPVAILGALMTAPLFGVSIDQVSLFAFILVLGILVDDAIVVGENVYTHESRTGDRRLAAVDGTHEVSVPVIFGVLTSVAAFVPLLVIPGRMGQIFFFMGVTVIACLTWSVVESQLVLPSHLSRGRSKLGETSGRVHGGVRRRWEAFQDRFARGLQRFTDERYRFFLRRVLAWRYLSVAAGLSLLMLAAGVVGSGRLSLTFFPPVEADYVAALLTMPQGTPAEVTAGGLAQLRQAARELAAELDPQYAPEGGSLVRHTLVSLGQQSFGAMNRRTEESGSHVGEVVLELLPSEQRKIGTRAIAQHWRERIGEIPDATEVVLVTDLFSAGSAIDLQLRGSRDAPLAEAAAAVRGRLAQYPGVVDIADSFRPGKREIQLEILPEAEPLGLAMEDLARQVRQAFYGEEAQRIQRGRDDVRVMVRYPESERRSLADLENMRIRTADGVEVPFFSVARAHFGRGFADIRRTNRRRVVNVTADVDRSRTTSNRVVADFRENALPAILARYPGVSVALEGEQDDQQKAVGGLLTAYGGALLAIYVLLAIPLGSYLQPLVIMAVIPFGIVGAVGGHLLMGRAMSFPSLLGVVALSGVVVNASLVLVVAVNRRRAAGDSLRKALEHAGTSRFRPILLTAVTTFAGLTPLMLETSLQAQILIPMAVSLAYGVVFATAITLFLLPCAYLILEDVARLWRRRQRVVGGPRPPRNAAA
jgi:multidrug efflux pump subunit AcrB